MIDVAPIEGLEVKAACDACAYFAEEILQEEGRKNRALHCTPSHLGAYFALQPYLQTVAKEQITH